MSYLVRYTKEERGMRYPCRYLEIRPFDQVWGWFAGDTRHATPMDIDLADRLAAIFRDRFEDPLLEVEVIEDPRDRPAFDDQALMAEQLVQGR